MKLFIIVLALSVSIVACSMGGKPVINLELFKSLFYLDSKVGMAYKKECEGKRYSSGKCKTDLVKKEINLCDPDTFNSLVRERYILIKESDFLK